MGDTFRRGDRVALLLAAANSDHGIWQDPATFRPDRRIKPNSSFGAGLHSCVGAPLARLELQTALPIVCQRLSCLKRAGSPIYGNT